MTIPEIRVELLMHGQNLGIPRLLELAAEMHRRPPIRKAPPRRERKVTQVEVVRYFRTHPLHNNMDAAIHFGVNNRAISNAHQGGPRR
jgi:hypothetical protein